MNKREIGKLIDHYRALKGVPDWTVAHCVSGVLHRWHGWDMNMRKVLDIDQEECSELTCGQNAPWVTSPQFETNVERRDRVVAMLEELRETGRVNWRAGSAPDAAA